jgi:hypothetical protein
MRILIGPILKKQLALDMICSSQTSAMTLEKGDSKIRIALLT